ncbi:hypothetical protein [Candidatus Pelagibacter sp. Uisw_134_02]|uniref:hypothetical protein n=1 Tax=Candidatus Pelagibacter sp. Uisw_134_02 TaxID=3230990 RepID=UPI0039ED5969
MKRLLLILILTLSFQFSTEAIEYQISSKHWNSNTNGPTTIEGAIKRFFINSRLEPIEGIWYESNFGWFAIKKEEGGSFKKWQIKSTNPALDGSIEATINKDSVYPSYTGSVRIEWPDPNDKNWFVFATSDFSMKMDGNDLIEYRVKEFSAQPETFLIRIWPFNLDEYNKEFF